MNYKVSRELITEWVGVVVRRGNGADSFLDALSLAWYSSDLSEREKSILHTLHNLYLAELSGKIIPPINLDEVYLRVLRGEDV